MQPPQKRSKKKFTHLHVHSHYSLLDGLSKIPDLLDRVKELGMDSVAITDHGVMYGVVEFYKEAKKRGIKPIFGLEAYISNRSMRDKQPGIDDKRYHLILLAKNKEGYKNLIELSTKSHLEGFYYKPRVDKTLLREYGKGIIALSGCLTGEISRAILSGDNNYAEKLVLEYKNIFSQDGEDNFYLEIQRHPPMPEQEKVNKQLIEFSKKFNLPLVATADSHYLRSEDAEAHDILLAIQTGDKITDEKRSLTMKDSDFSIKSPEEMEELFKDTPEAIENTQRIAGACNVELELGKNQLPYYKVPMGYNANSYLKELCAQGLAKRYPLLFNASPQSISPLLAKEGRGGGEADSDIRDSILARLNHEIDIIQQTGFASYFLIVQDFVNWAKGQDIVVGPGRGSAAGSIVSYLLNITNIDPLKYNLIFERFLEKDRNELPDIDIDFADTRRDEVIEYVAQKYGRENVSQIITFGTMAARASVRDVGRALGYPYDFCDKLAKTIPMMMNFEKALKESQEFQILYTSDRDAKRIVDAARKLEGVARHASTHACGVVITKDPLTNIVPLQSSSHGDNSIISQYEMHSVEDLGLLKMDFLGLRNLTIIQNAMEQIKERRGIEINLDEIPLDDTKTIELLQKANTTGVFQLESSGIKRYLKELKPTKFEDIIAMVALYRPGPMELIPDFINRKRGKTAINYLHPKLEPILEDTYGIAVYQEQVLQIARELAGFTYSEADVLRKAIGKKIKELLEKQREKFIKGMIRNGIEQRIAERLFTFVEPFARYGFNKAHSTCYATIGFHTAYLKAHYPQEFMAALLNAEQRNIERISFLIDEAKGMGINVLPPDINESDKTFAVSDKGIRFGMAAIKNVGNHIVEEIIKEKKAHGAFSSIENLLERVNDRDLNKKSLESLIKSGAFDAFEERNKLLENIETILRYGQNLKSRKLSFQGGLFDDEPTFKNTLNLNDAMPATKRQALAWEKELLGFYVSSHPMEEFQDKLSGFPKIKSITSRSSGKTVKIAGIISGIKKIITKSGHPMLFVEIEDMSSKIEGLVFPSTLEKHPEIFNEGKALELSGRISTRDGEVKLLCEEVKEL